MPAVGARALFSATRTHATRHRHVAIGSCISNRRQLDARTFRTYSPSCSKPAEEPNGPKHSEDRPEKPVGENGSIEKTGDDAHSASIPTAQSAAPVKEAPKSQGHGSRARAWRVKGLEEMPPVTVPPWYEATHIWMYDEPWHGTGRPLTRMPRNPRDLAELTADNLWGDSVLVFNLLRPMEVTQNSTPEKILEYGRLLLRRVQNACDVARWYLLAVEHHTKVPRGVLDWLKNIHAPRSTNDDMGSNWVEWVRPTLTADDTGVWCSAAALMREPELSAFTELVCRARNELAAVAPKSKAAGQLPRPVTVLSVLNCKGQTVPMAIMRSLAYELRADVVHIDAVAIAIIIGNYLGQTPYHNKGALSTLGYAVAELNGRLSTVAESADDAQGTVTFNIPFLGRLRSSVPKMDKLLLGSSDERWDDLKIGQAFEALIRTVETKRSSLPNPSKPERPLIIHLHDFVELRTVSEGIVQKLQAVVDRLSQKGKRILLLGSTSSDVKTSIQWRAQLKEMSTDDCHVIPYHTNVDVSTRAAVEKCDNLVENMRNIKNMRLALEGDEAKTQWTRLKPYYLLPKSRRTLESSVLDVQTVYRLTSLLLGSGSQSIGPQELEDGVSFMDRRDSEWIAHYAGIPPFHHYRGSNLTGSGNRGSRANMGSDDSGDGASMPSHEQQLDKYEKNLMSNLINAKDIRTTFGDIIAPEKMIESIKALTSLSIIRPEAFSYGILKTERIPGLLMYGPPGTGKTLLAKAIAKESGANMLEISSATINNMYVGQSEKNVQALFSVARKHAPMIIFLDEGDALLGKRGGGHGNGNRRAVLTQFLREMDGLTEANKQVFVVVATNRPFDLDEAVLRRLPRKMLVDLPLQPEREAILRILLREETLDEATVSLQSLATETDLYSGSDLKNLCVAAAMDAVKEEMRAYAAAGSPKEGYIWPEKRVLTKKHFDAATREIGASISEDMESLKAIRKFDEQYGDASGRKRKSKRSMGFEVVTGTSGSEAARVRTLLS